MLRISCNVSQLYMYQFIVTVFDNSSSSKSQSLTPCSNTKSAVLMPYCSRTLCIFCQIVQVPNLQVYQTVQVICHIFCLFFSSSKSLHLPHCSSNMSHVLPHYSSSKVLYLSDCSDLPDCSSNVFHVFPHCSNSI